MVFVCHDSATTYSYTVLPLSLHDALPISGCDRPLSKKPHAVELRCRAPFLSWRTSCQAGSADRLVAFGPSPAVLRCCRHREIGRAHVCTPVTKAHLVCRLLLE